MEHEFSVVVDHHQFYLHDAAPDLVLAFTFNDMDAGLEALPAGLMINTRRAAGAVPLVVSLAASRPAADFDDWLHVVEASLTISSGGLTVSSPWNEPAPPLPLPNGSYGVIVYYGDIDTAEYDYDNGADHYWMVLWPADPQPTHVLKRYEDEDEVLPYTAGLSVEQLATVLVDGNISQRCHVAVSLCRFATPQAITAVSTALHDRSLSVARTATAALFLTGPLAVGPTLQQLTARDARTRQRAIEVLARLHDDEAARPLLTAAVAPLVAALSDVEQAVRQRAAATLGRLADEQAVPLLLPCRKVAPPASEHGQAGDYLQRRTSPRCAGGAGATQWTQPAVRDRSWGR